MDKTYSEYFEAYIYYISFEKKLSESTINRYKKELEFFFCFLKESDENFDENIDDKLQNEKIIKKYIYHLVAVKGNKENTINRKISTLRGFYNFLISDKDFNVTINPMLNIRNQKLAKKLPLYLTVSECEKFLYGIKFFSRYALRDYAIFNFFLSTGARLSEVTKLKLSQVNMQNGVVKIYGKGKKERLAVLTNSALNALKKYLEAGDNKDVSVKGRMPAVNTDIVFLNKYGKPFTEKGIYMLFISLSKKIGIYKKGLSPHKLRHTFATLLKSNGADIVELQKLLGHTSLSSTQIYTHVADEEVLRKVKMLHPLNSKEIDDDFIQRIRVKNGKK